MNKKVIALMPNMKGGGAQRVMSLLLKNAADSGYKVELLLIDKSAPIEYDLENKIKVTYIPGQCGNKIIRRVKLLRYLRTVTCQNREAVFLSFLTERNLDLLLVAPRNVKVIVSERNDPSRSIKDSAIWHKLREILYKRAAMVVFQTPDAKEYFAHVKRIRGCIISNPLTDNLPYHKKENKSNVVISVARLSQQKNYPMLMDAFEKVYEKHPEYELHIWGKEYGEAGITDKLHTHASHLKCKDAIKFMGFSNDVHPHVAEASIFVSSSDYEGMSNSMLEALGIGIPCVCTDCPIGGARMFIKNGQNGLLVPVNDTAKMADALIRMIEDKELRLRCYENADAIRSELNETKIFERWKGIIEKNEN